MSRALPDSEHLPSPGRGRQTQGPITGLRRDQLAWCGVRLEVGARERQSGAHGTLLLTLSRPGFRAAGSPPPWPKPVTLLVLLRPLAVRTVLSDRPPEPPPCCSLGPTWVGRFVHLQPVLRPLSFLGQHLDASFPCTRAAGVGPPPGPLGRGTPWKGAGSARGCGLGTPLATPACSPALLASQEFSLGTQAGSPEVTELL